MYQCRLYRDELVWVQRCDAVNFADHVHALNDKTFFAQKDSGHHRMYDRLSRREISPRLGPLALAVWNRRRSGRLARSQQLVLVIVHRAYASRSTQRNLPSARHSKAP